MKKIAIIGSGHVGVMTLHYIAKSVLADIVLIDVIKDLPQAKAYDELFTKQYAKTHSVNIKGSNTLCDIAGADIVIHTAGVARKPDMSRMDLLKTNLGIAKEVAIAIKTYASQAIVIVVSNPLDIIAMAMFCLIQCDKKKIIGMSGVLDSARYRYCIAEEMNINTSDVQTLVLGGHGDSMVPVTDCATVAGMPVSSFLPSSTIAKMEKRTREGGAEIVSYLKTGSAYYAPAASVMKMVKALIGEKKSILSASVFLQGEYGFHDIFLGVPVIIGNQGIERIIQVPLSHRQKEDLAQSAREVQSMIQKTNIVFA